MMKLKVKVIAKCNVGAHFLHDNFIGCYFVYRKTSFVIGFQPIKYPLILVYVSHRLFDYCFVKFTLCYKDGTLALRKRENKLRFPLFNFTKQIVPTNERHLNFVFIRVSEQFIKKCMSHRIRADSMYISHESHDFDFLLLIQAIKFTISYDDLDAFVHFTLIT